MTESKSSTTERVLAATGVVGIATGVFVATYFNPVTAGFFPLCPFHALTGLNCPGCGLTRGFNALFHGDFLNALHLNALIPLYALIFGYILLSLIFTTIRGRGLPWQFFKPWMVFGLLFISLAFGVLRNLPFYPFNLLAI